MIQSVGIVGYGNVAYQIANRLYSCSIKPTFISGRDSIKGSELARSIESKYVTIDNIPAVDLIIVAVADNAIESVFDQLKNYSTIIVHTSGSTSVSNLNKFGVLYPFQTFTKSKKVNWDNVPVLVEANIDSIENKLYEFAKTLSNTVIRTTTSNRQKLHLAGVLTNNFINHIGALTTNLMHDANLNMELLRPLLEETIEVILTQQAQEKQTGPAKRNDSNTLNTHRKLLINQPDILEVYNTLTKSIQSQ
jgi:predicted short-subunit dehydrogenase-like oxidoreductase (DUF2520 family)